MKTGEKMKIIDIINSKKVTVSFEVFPPKQWDKIANTKKIVEEMVKDKPSFMSVTYGAAAHAPPPWSSAPCPG